jgi:hypothetical protein
MYQISNEYLTVWTKKKKCEKLVYRTDGRSANLNPFDYVGRELISQFLSSKVFFNHSFRNWTALLSRSVNMNGFGLEANSVNPVSNWKKICLQSETVLWTAQIIFIFIFWDTFSERYLSILWKMLQSSSWSFFMAYSPMNGLCHVLKLVSSYRWKIGNINICI